MALRQTSYVVEYRHRFEVLSPHKDISNTLLLGVFLNGLQEDVKSEMQVTDLVDLDQVFMVAQNVEDKLGLACLNGLT